MAECVICGRAVPPGEEEEDQKPTLLNEEETREVERSKELERNLRCFCKLLGLDETGEVRGLGEEERKCCLECSAALGEVARLEREIEELRVAQNALVEQLKGYLVAVEVDDQFKGHLRRQLISCCMRNPPFPADPSPAQTPATVRVNRKRKAGAGKKMASPTTQVPGIKMEECFVRLERLTPPLPPIKEETCKKIEKEVKVHKRASRRSKTKALQTLQRVASRSPSPVSPSMSPEWSADYGEDASGQEDNEEGSNSASSKLEDKELVQKPPPMRKPKLSFHRKRKLCKNFHQITDNLLLFRNTLIRVTEGKSRFTCLEPGCQTEFQDLSSWSVLFLQMQKHVEENHPWDARSGEKVCCPLCPRKLECGTPSLRKHLLKDHSREHVICEVCWRPIRHLATAYKCHLWHHKSAEEMQNSDMPTQIANRKQHPKRATGKTWRGKGRVSKKKDRYRVSSCEVLSKLSDTHFLYKFTVFRLAPGEGLYCDEPACHELVVPESGVTFNIMARLGEMKDHVNLAHASHTEEYSRTQRRCPLCPDEGESRRGFEFRRHLLRAGHRKVPYMCTWCWRPCVNTQIMKIHAQSHVGQQETKTELDIPSAGVFKCSTCGKEFGHKVNLNNHEVTHVPKHLRKKQYRCDTCGVYLSSATALKEHTVRIHQPHLQKFRSCPICEMKIPVRSLGQFKNHLRSHRNERPFVCDKCGQGFLAQQTFKRHLERVHAEERKYQCEFCDMRYKDPDSLRRHQKSVHHDQISEELKPDLNKKPADKQPGFIGPVRMYPCPVCEKLFQLRSRMTKHLAKSH